LAGRFELEARQLRALAEVLRERIQILADADPVCELVLPEPDLSSPDALEALREPTAGRALREVERRWETLQSWTRDELKEELAAGGRDAGLKGRSLYHPVRAALTGAVQGPDVPDVAYILGRETTAGRLAAGLAAAEDDEAGGT
jgi:glutamyl/glutaminyl-tRNA synthetase